MKTILVAGGAGYIGSHMVALLVERGLMWWWRTICAPATGRR